MPPARAYWVIVAGNTPTAFRARNDEDLIPTLRQLQRTQPHVTLAWFERNRLWASPAAAEEDQLRRRKQEAARGKSWRPGGDHQDAGERYKIGRDERRQRFKQRQHKKRNSK